MSDDDEIVRLRTEIEERRARLLVLEPPLTFDDLKKMTVAEIRDLPPGVRDRALGAMTVRARGR